MDKLNLIEFARPYYANKDIMHNLWHIELVDKWVNKILKISNYDVDIDCLTYATYFHGFIYVKEDEIRKWLFEQGLSEYEINKIAKVAYESQRMENPETIEGKILHDAHLLEGGKTYIITKCLITGSVRGQTLIETINYIENNILDKAKCYLPETIPFLAEANSFAKEFIRELKSGISC